MTKLVGYLIPALETEYLGKNTNSNDYFKKACLFFKQGVRAIQIIAEKKEFKTYEIIKKKLPNIIIIGGGNINTVTEAENFLTHGCDFVIMEKALVNNPNLIENLLDRINEKLIVSISDKNGKITHDTNLKTIEYTKFLIKKNVNNLLYVNEAKKLQNKGISTFLFSKIRKIARKQVLIYSGGITTLNDVKKIILIGADSIISGTALYRKNLNFKEAQEVITYDKQSNN